MASGTITKKFSVGYQLIVDWESTSNISSNSSTVTCNVKLYCPYRLGISARTNNELIINGVTYYFNTPAISNYNAATHKLFTVTSGAIPHNADGSKSITITCYFDIEATISDKYYGRLTATGNAALDSIPRQATITAAPNFNDEANPAISYSNSAGTAVTSLQACIANSTGGTIYVPYRDISKTGSSYTFNLTEAERNTLRNATPNSNTMTVKFYVKTVIAGVTYYSNLSKTLSIVNGSPTLSPTATDSNSAAVALTGDANKFIKYYSNAAVNAGAAAKKGATLKSYKITCGGKSITTASGTINAVEGATFVFSVTDSRGNTSTKTLTKTLINYVRLSCDLSAEAPTTAGDMTFKISGNYFNGSIGSTANTLTVQYRLKTGDAAWGGWTTVTATKSGNTYTYNGSLSGLNYQTTYGIQARAVDKLATVNTLIKYVKSVPVFDWGADDFNFNVPVTITDGYLVYPLLGMCKAMTSTYNCSVSVTAGANYSSASGSATICGNTLRCNIVATRSAAFSGDGANETVATISINHGGKIAGMLNVSFPNGSTGATSSLYTSNVTQTEDTLTFNVWLAAASGSTTGINSFFQVPITLNLSAFV